MKTPLLHFLSRLMALALLLSLNSALAQSFSLSGDFLGGDTYDRMGTSVAISADGNRVAMSAPNWDANSKHEGYVRVYQRNGSNWDLMPDPDGVLKGKNLTDDFGCSVSLSADGYWLAVGASAFPVMANGAKNLEGEVRTFWWSGSENKWIEFDVALTPDPSRAAWKFFGASVSLSDDGKRLAIGAPMYYNAAERLRSGYVQVYERDDVNDEWVLLGADIDGKLGDNGSGFSVSLSGNGEYLVIGAPYTSGATTGAGRVRIYKWSGSQWDELGTGINGSVMNGYLGYSVSISDDGQRVAVGEPGSDTKGIRTGHTQVYEWDGSNWSPVASAPIEGESIDNNDGAAVSLSSDGNTVCVGAPRNQDDGFIAGQVRLFTLVPDPSNAGQMMWSQVGSDVYPTVNAGFFGNAVSLSGDGLTFVGGAAYAVGQRGVVEVHTLQGLPPAAPKNLVAEDLAFLVLIQWQDNSSNEDGYRVYRNGDPTPVADITNGNTWFWENIIPLDGQTYTYEVEAYNAFGASTRVSVDYISPDPATYLPLTLDPSPCYNVGAQTLTWTVNNPNAYTVPFTPFVWNSGQTFNLRAPAGTSTFTTDVVGTGAMDNATGIYFWEAGGLTIASEVLILDLSSLPTNCRLGNVQPALPMPEMVKGPQARPNAGDWLASHLEIAPNPTQGMLLVNPLTQSEQPAAFAVSNLMGQELIRTSGDLSRATKLNLSEFPAGIYLLEVRTSGISAKLKIVKE